MDNNEQATCSISNRKDYLINKKSTNINKFNEIQFTEISLYVLSIITITTIINSNK